MNQQYLLTGKTTYKISSILDQYDTIVPVTGPKADHKSMLSTNLAQASAQQYFKLCKTQSCTAQKQCVNCRQDVKMADTNQEDQPNSDVVNLMQHKKSQQQQSSAQTLQCISCGQFITKQGQRTNEQTSMSGMSTNFTSVSNFQPRNTNIQKQLQNDHNDNVSCSANFDHYQGPSQINQQCKDCMQSNKSATPNYTEIMKNRWHAANSQLPEVDKTDLSNESFFTNSKTVSLKHQHNPEFSQTSYMRIRSLEEAFAMRNYLDPAYNKSQEKEKLAASQQATNYSKKGKFKILGPYDQISQFDRSYAIQKIFDLHMKKDYKVETLFIACSILDRFLFTIGWQTFPRDQMCRLATTAMLMAAKLEQPVSPSFSRMISLLTEEEQALVNKKLLIELEAQILITMNFDYNFPGPIQSMERYLRILEYDFNRTVYDMSYQITKFQLNDSQFLDFKPSQMAACSIIISVNIYERDVLRVKIKQGFSLDKKDSDFFGDQINTIQDQMKNGTRRLLKFNTDIWNNPKVLQMTGYSIESIKEPLLQLLNFIQDNLSPNRLEGFDLDSVKKVKNFKLQDEIIDSSGSLKKNNIN